MRRKKRLTCQILILLLSSCKSNLYKTTESSSSLNKSQIKIALSTNIHELPVCNQEARNQIFYVLSTKNYYIRLFAKPHST